MAEKISYICTRCKYKFKHNPAGEVFLKCPYCGKDDRIIEDKAANSIVKEITDNGILDDF